MIVLHIARLARESFLWGEVPAMTGAYALARRSRNPSLPALAFGANKEALAAAVAEIRPGFCADEKGRKQTRVVWLPSVRGQPLASTPIIAPPPEPSDPISLAPWSVVALRWRRLDILGQRAALRLSACHATKDTARARQWRWQVACMLERRRGWR
jgi:hypothetical protein